MDYFYTKVHQAADEIGGTPQREAFAIHLHQVATALHDIEWVDSGDYGYGDENGSIMQCITAGSVLEASVNRAEKALSDLIDALKSVKETGGK